MQPDDLIFPAAFHKGTAYFLERADRWSSSYFGGPSEVAISGLAQDATPLHHIVTFGCRELPSLGSFGLRMSLFYGMRYSGCRIQCRKLDTSNLEVSEVTPIAATPDWPYPCYPPYLPYVPMRVSRTLQCDLRVFSELSVQPQWQVSPGHLIVIVPASPVVGMSLWGPDGDAERVQIVFECDVSHGSFRGFNQCA